ncbi:MAG: hypothetical protein FVQ84_08510 [Planctomycetes bacterium]|nr:hypothetical protein [Planctomycetota bacterium]
MATRIERAVKKFKAGAAEFSKTVVPVEFVSFQKLVAFDLLERLVLKTAVDLGGARGNWQLTIGTPASGTTGRVGGGAEAEADRGTEGKAGADAINAASAVLASLKPFQTVYITNNLKYIEPLEKGSSSQSPEGMIAVSLEEVNLIFG